MNLRNKFIWNLVITMSIISVIWCTWSLYNINFETNKLFEDYKNEEVGTDKRLQNKVTELEGIYTYRKELQFKIAENPFDLSRVIIDGGKRSKLWISGIINRPDGSIMAILNFKNSSYNVVKGDSIAGGVIDNITSTEVIFKKEDRLHYFNLGVDNNIE